MTDNHPASGLWFEERPFVKSLRDEIAISSLGGFVASGHAVKTIPQKAYELADGMLAEMRKGGKS